MRRPIHSRREDALVSKAGCGCRNVSEILAGLLCRLERSTMFTAEAHGDLGGLYEPVARSALGQKEKVVTWNLWGHQDEM